LSAVEITFPIPVGRTNSFVAPATDARVVFYSCILEHHPMHDHSLATPTTTALADPVPTRTDAEATDDQLLALWLHGRAPLTIRAYRREAARFRSFVAKPLRLVTLGDLQAFADSLDGKPGTRSRVLATIKSLLSFATKLGALRFNVGAALRAPTYRETLADRILSEADVARMLALTHGRNHALLRLAYAGGLRVAELVALRWSDLADAEDETLFVTVLGKGGKARTVRVSAATGYIVRALRGEALSDGHVFAGRRGGLNASQAWRIVRAAARRAGIKKDVSPHFLRHAHASHALERGVKVTVIRDTLGHSSIAITDRYAHARPEESSGLALAV
jgi:site-specific recombinase XerD